MELLPSLVLFDPVKNEVLHPFLSIFELPLRVKQPTSSTSELALYALDVYYNKTYGFGGSSYGSGGGSSYGGGGGGGGGGYGGSGGGSSYGRWADAEKSLNEAPWTIASSILKQFLCLVKT